MNNLLSAMGRIFFLSLTSLTLVLVLLALTGCVTTRAETPDCQSLVRDTARAATDSGYALVEVAHEAVGEVAVFVSGSTARLFYLTPLDTVAEYLEERGWKPVGECRGKDGQSVRMLQKEVAISSNATPA